MSVVLFSLLIGIYDMNKLTAETMVPISIIAVLAGGIFWLSVMYADLSHATSQIDSLKTDMERINVIDTRLSRIEGKIDILVGRK